MRNGRLTAALGQRGQCLTHGIALSAEETIEARRFLEGLETRFSGELLRRVYAAQFRLDGDLRYAWRWLRSAIRKPQVETSFS